jgi:hypothetical protein
MKTSITLELDEELFIQLKRNVPLLFKDNTPVEDWMCHSIEYMAFLLHSACKEECRDVLSPLYGKLIPFAGKHFNERMR